MAGYSQIQKFISVLMIFILLTYLSGCTSTRIVSTSNLPRSSTKFAYIIHGEKLKYLLEKKSTISNDTLFGKIKQIYFDNSFDAGNKVHLYLYSDTAINIYNENEFLSVSLIHVTKAEVHEIYGVGTSFIFIGLAFVVYLVVGLATLDFSGMFDGW